MTPSPLKARALSADLTGMRILRALARAEEGFTLPELMTAAMVLVVGMAGVIGSFSQIHVRTNTNNQRVGATNLARELTERMRGASYTTLTDGGIGAFEGQYTRRGVQYTVDAETCVFDDPADSMANTASAGAVDWCPRAASASSTDPNGDDFRHVTLTLSWTDKGRTRQVVQDTMIVNPAGGLGPRITSFPSISGQITSGDTASFDLTTTTAQTVKWNADDATSRGAATGGPTDWDIAWDIGTVGDTSDGWVLDGAYSIVAQAYDDRDIAGEAKVATVTINRSEPFAPGGFYGGHNTSQSPGFVDLLWGLNPERDIIGYRVYWAGPDGTSLTSDDELVCPAGGGHLDASTNACQVTNPAAGEQTYFVRALDRDTADQPRMGGLAELVIPVAGAQPAAPDQLTVSTVDGLPRLTWTASATPGILMYRIYRNGTDVASRYESVSDTTEWTDGDGDSLSRQYWVTAVDQNFNESDPVGPVQWP